MKKTTEYEVRSIVIDAIQGLWCKLADLVEADRSLDEFDHDSIMPDEVENFAEDRVLEFVRQNDLIKSVPLEAEAFYTGGGIWLSARYLNNITYAVVDSDDPLCLTYYDHRNEDNDTDFPCQSPFRSVGIEEMNSADLELWKELARELHKKAF